MLNQPLNVGLNIDNVLAQSNRLRLDDKDVAMSFWQFDRSVFRLETLDTYAVPSDDKVYSAYLAGETLPPQDPNWNDWYNKMDSAVQAGKTMTRLHVVPAELTSYLKYEIEWAYAHFNSKFGEKVFILVREEFPDLASLAKEDFFLFDESRVMYVNFDQNNHWTGMEVEQNRTVIDKQIEVMGQLLQVAQPLQEFLPRLRSSPIRVR